MSALGKRRVSTTTQDVLQEVKRRAASSGAQPSTAGLQQPKGLAAPMFVRLETHNGAELAEDFLWRLTEPQASVSTAVLKLCAELNYKAAPDKAVEQQFDTCLQRYKGMDGRGTEQLVRLKVTAHLGGRVFSDHLIWDLAQQQHMAVEQYAASVCQDLRLSAEWMHAISAALRASLSQAKDAKPMTAQELCTGGLVRDPAEGSIWGPRIQPLSSGLGTPGRASHPSVQLKLSVSDAGHVAVDLRCLPEVGGPR